MTTVSGISDWKLFAENASLGAIEHQLGQAVLASRRAAIHQAKLEDLYQLRAAQIEAGAWPPEPNAWPPEASDL